MLQPDDQKMRLMKEGWRERIGPHSAGVAAQIFLAKSDGWKVAVLQAQGLKRGLKHRFGFDIRKNRFLTRGHKRRAMKDDFTPFCLHSYTFGVAREMVNVASMLAVEVDAGRLEYGPNAFNALASIHSDMMQCYIPYELYVRQTGRRDEKAALSVLTSYVRSGLKRTVPGNRKEGGYDMHWAQAIMASHPDLSFEQALQEELPTQILLSLPEIAKPHHLFMLRGKVSDAFKKQHLLKQEEGSILVDLQEDTKPAFGEFEAKAIIDQLGMIHEAKQVLNAREFQVFKLKETQKSPEEIAQLLDLKPGTVRNLEFTLREKLRKAWNLPPK